MPNDSKFTPASAAFAVSTYYPRWYRGRLRSIKHTDKVRGDLALEFFRKTKALGYHVVVADGKSSKTFRNELSNIKGLIVIKRRSLKRSVARRQTIRYSSKLQNVKVIILTEAEKISLIDFIPRLIQPIITGKADIVIPQREKVLFQKTYPTYQYESEIEGNKLYNETLRANGLFKDNSDLDLFFGPRVLRNSKNVASLFLRKYRVKFGKNIHLKNYFEPEEYSATSFFPIVLALKKGCNISSVEIPFSYPHRQKENEEKGSKESFEQKRRNQRISLLIDLLYFLNTLKKH